MCMRIERQGDSETESTITEKAKTHGRYQPGTRRAVTVEHLATTHEYTGTHLPKPKEPEPKTVRISSASSAAPTYVCGANGKTAAKGW